MTSLDDQSVSNDYTDEIPKACDPPSKPTSVIGSLSFVDRFLSLWIISVMVIGVVVGFYSPVTQEGLSRIAGL